MTIPALTAGLQGMQQGMQQLRKDASDVAQATNPDNAADAVDVATSLVHVKLDKLQVEASAKVVETVHDLLGQLLDEKA